MDRVTLAEAWKTYREMAVPKDAHATQVDETQKAFYAGALVVLMAVERISEPDVSEDAGVVILGAMYAEVKRFVAERQKASAAGDGEASGAIVPILPMGPVRKH